MLTTSIRVCKNGNLLLNVPLRGDGTPDEDELSIIEGIAQWMDVNKSAIHGTRPWQVFGEGPQMADAAPIEGQGFNEGKGKPFTSEDLRFTTKGDVLYVFVMGVPKADIHIKSLGTDAKLLSKKIVRVSRLGSDEAVRWSQSAGSLLIEAPRGPVSDMATVFEVSTK